MLKINKKKQMSETLLIGGLLAVSGGYLDAYTFLSRGEVFANAQTGNIVLFGIYMAKGEWGKVFRYLVPILAFVCGVLIAQVIKEKFQMSQRFHWRQLVLCLEVLALIIVGILPKESGDMIANVLISFVCSMQVQAFRKLNGNAYATTMCTGNLRSAIEAMWTYRKDRKNENLKKGRAYLTVILCFIIGAVLGCLFNQTLEIYSVYIPVIFLFICLLIMLISPKKTEQ